MRSNTRDHTQMEDKERRQKHKMSQSIEKRRETKNGEEINTKLGTVGGTLISHYHEPRETGDEGLHRRRLVKLECRDGQ